VFAAVFGAAGRIYQISQYCLQHFDNYFHFSSFLLILKGLLQKIFSASPAVSGENEAQSVNSSDDRLRTSEESKRESARESISGKVSQKPIHPLERI